MQHFSSTKMWKVYRTTQSATLSKTSRDISWREAHLCCVSSAGCERQASEAASGSESPSADPRLPPIGALGSGSCTTEPAHAYSVLNSQIKKSTLLAVQDASVGHCIVSRLLCAWLKVESLFDIVLPMSAGSKCICQRERHRNCQVKRTSPPKALDCASAQDNLLT